MTRCFYIAQELAPYFTEGGLGLTAAALPRELAQRFGIAHTLCLPFYPSLVARAGLHTECIAEVPGCPVRGIRRTAAIHRLIHDGVFDIILVRCDDLYERDGGIYRDKRYVEYTDAAARAAFFGTCLAQWIEASGESFDLVHGNDWQSGMALLRLQRARGGAARPRLLYNIHNAEYRGAIDPAELVAMGLDRGELEAVKHCGADVSLMALGLYAADAIVTCSPTYARDLCAMLRGTPMEETIVRLGCRGIVSGVDPSSWDPRNAPGGAYDASNLSAGKRANKAALQEHLRLANDAAIPLYGVCTRLVPEKGIDALINVLGPAVQRGTAQLVVVGSGDPAYHEALRSLAAATPRYAHFAPEFDPTLARLTYAGSDFTPMPSLFEPCGLNQLIALRYGTLPIVSPVGGLVDTVRDIAADPTRGNGFVLAAPTADALSAACTTAEQWLAHSGANVEAIRRRAMGEEWSWTRTAREFVELYAEIVGPAAAVVEATSPVAVRLARRLAIVTTTIHVPAVLGAYAAQVERKGCDTVTVVVVGDRKTPAATRRYLDMLKSARVEVEYMDVEAQRRWLERFPELDCLLPWNSIQRRNIGYLRAAELGAEVIIAIDDDNAVTDDDFLEHHRIVGGEHNLEEIASSSGWYNCCEALETDPSVAIVPRGFPTSQRHVRPVLTRRNTRARVVVNAGLWLGDPDVDAITRIVTPVQVTKRRVGAPLRIALAPGTFCPFNSQNTAFSIDLLPCMYLIVMGDRYRGASCDRYDDIWMSYIAKRIIDRVGDRITFGAPLVRQDRNAHDLLIDLLGEAPAMLLTESLLRHLRAIELKERTYEAAYGELIELLRGRVADPRCGAPDEREFFESMLKGMQVFWRVCQDVRPS